MRLLVYSDLHLDRRPFNPVLPCGESANESVDVVILAGDIDEGIGGIRWARETFIDKPILYVAGNHEFYGHNWISILDSLREEANHFEVTFLETDSVTVGGFRFLGCTLWSDYALLGENTSTRSMDNARSGMSDFKSIHVTRTAESFPNASNTLCPEMVLARHRGSVKWLRDMLAKEESEPTVVITHHAPHLESIPPTHREHRLSPAYASDLSDLLAQAQLWIHGHIHAPVDYSLGNTRVISNPRGDLLKGSRKDHPRFKQFGIWEI